MATDPVNQPPSTPSSGKEPEISVKATENIEPLVAVIDLTASDIEDASEERSSRARSSEFREEDEDWGNEEIEYADPEEQLADDLDGAARKQLQSAIATVPIRRLREIVARVALTDAAVEHSLAHELLGLNTTTRTLVPRWAVCMHCGDEYSPQQQGDELDCAFHEGILEPNEEKFVDWEESERGPKDTARNRDELPERFIWSCCDKDGTQAGCVRRHHESSRKRRRT